MSKCIYNEDNAILINEEISDESCRNSMDNDETENDEVAGNSSTNSQMGEKVYTAKELQMIETAVSLNLMSNNEKYITKNAEVTDASAVNTIKSGNQENFVNEYGLNESEGFPQYGEFTEEIISTVSVSIEEIDNSREFDADNEEKNEDETVREACVNEETVNLSGDAKTCDDRTKVPMSNKTDQSRETSNSDLENSEEMDTAGIEEPCNAREVRSNNSTQTIEIDSNKCITKIDNSRENCPVNKNDTIVISKQVNENGGNDHVSQLNKFHSSNDVAQLIPFKRETNFGKLHYESDYGITEEEMKIYTNAEQEATSSGNVNIKEEELMKVIGRQNSSRDEQLEIFSYKRDGSHDTHISVTDPEVSTANNERKNDTSPRNISFPEATNSNDTVGLGTRENNTSDIQWLTSKLMKDIAKGTNYNTINEKTLNHAMSRKNLWDLVEGVSTEKNLKRRSNSLGVEDAEIFLTPDLFLQSKTQSHLNIRRLSTQERSHNSIQEFDGASVTSRNSRRKLYRTMRRRIDRQCSIMFEDPHIQQNHDNEEEISNTKRVTDEITKTPREKRTTLLSVFWLIHLQMSVHGIFIGSFEKDIEIRKLVTMIGSFIASWLATCYTVYFLCSQLLPAWFIVYSLPFLFCHFYTLILCMAALHHRTEMAAFVRSLSLLEARNEPMYLIYPALTLAYSFLNYWLFFIVMPPDAYLLIATLLPSLFNPGIFDTYTMVVLNGLTGYFKLIREDIERIDDWTSKNTLEIERKLKNIGNSIRLFNKVFSRCLLARRTLFMFQILAYCYVVTAINSLDGECIKLFVCSLFLCVEILVRLSSLCTRGELLTLQHWRTHLLLSNVHLKNYGNKWKNVVKTGENKARYISHPTLQISQPSASYDNIQETQNTSHEKYKSVQDTDELPKSTWNNGTPASVSLSSKRFELSGIASKLKKSTKKGTCLKILHPFSGVLRNERDKSPKVKGIHVEKSSNEGYDTKSKIGGNAIKTLSQSFDFLKRYPEVPSNEIDVVKESKTIQKTEYHTLNGCPTETSVSSVISPPTIPVLHSVSNLNRTNSVTENCVTEKMNDMSIGGDSRARSDELAKVQNTPKIFIIPQIIISEIDDIDTHLSNEGKGHRIEASVPVDQSLLLTPRLIFADDQTDKNRSNQLTTNQNDRSKDGYEETHSDNCPIDPIMPELCQGPSLKKVDSAIFITDVSKCFGNADYAKGNSSKTEEKLTVSSISEDVIDFIRSHDGQDLKSDNSHISRSLKTDLRILSNTTSPEISDMQGETSEGDDNGLTPSKTCQNGHRKTRIPGRLRLIMLLDRLESKPAEFQIYGVGRLDCASLVSLLGVLVSFVALMLQVLTDRSLGSSALNGCYDSCFVKSE